MSEGGVTTKRFGGGFISPGIGILQSLQGILELVIRGIALILILATLISAAAAQNLIATLVSDTNTNIDIQTRAATGWILFVVIIALIYEVLFIIQRFINFKILYTTLIIVFIIVDAVFHIVCALGLFAGAVALATYVNEWRQLMLRGPNNLPAGPFPRRDDIASAVIATAFFSFILMIVFIGVAVFMIVGGFVLKWNPTRGKYKSGGGGGGEK